MKLKMHMLNTFRLKCLNVFVNQGPVTEGGQESSASVDAESKATQTNDTGI